MTYKALSRLRFLQLFLLITALVGTVVLAPTARASTITVNTTDDELNSDGDCSLREAIVSANTDTAVSGCAAGNGFDIINLPAGTYTFDLCCEGEDEAAVGDLDIKEGLSINGAGRVTTIIHGDGIDRVFDIFAGDVDIHNVTITRGHVNNNLGGGIRVNDGTLSLVNSRITNNSIGGGTFQGGGIYFSGESLDILVSWIDDNSATGVGGGLYLDYDSTWTLVNSRVENNTGGGSAGIHSNGTATILQSSISDNTATISTSGAGGLQSNGPLTMVNSTISGNSAPQGGGGMAVGSNSEANLYNVTIKNNTADSDGNNLGDGGGIRIGLGTVNLQNTIIAGNFDNSPSVIHADCSGTFVSMGYNLIQHSTGCVLTGDTTGNLVGVAAKLGTLADNGGSTLTHAPLAGSPAIDAGNPGGCSDPKGNSLTVDQRGYARPVNGNATPDATCDIGSFERLSPGTPTPTPSPTSSATATATSPATATPTLPATATVTATPTDGPSPTATNTATPGPSPTPTNTVTPGPSPTPTNTVTPGPSPTPTATSELPPDAQHRLYLSILMD